MKRLIPIAWSILTLMSAAEAQAGTPPKGAKAHAEANQDPKELTWADLRTFDYKAKRVPPKLEALTGKRIRIAGYVVPVESQPEAIEFLFVPDQLACIHVPPPPPNLMIKASADKAIDMRAATGARWLVGELSFFNAKSQYGEAGVEVIHAQLEDFK